MYCGCYVERQGDVGIACDVCSENRHYALVMKIFCSSISCSDPLQRAVSQLGL